MSKGAIIGIVVVVIVAVGGFFAYRYTQTAAEYANAKELAEESFVRENITTKTRYTSVIDAPLEKVQKAVWDLENSSRWVDSIKLSDLVKKEGNTKTLKMQVKPPTLPMVQHYTMQFTLHPDENRVTFHTVEPSPAQDVKGSYHLEPAGGGDLTVMVYESVATDKVAVPFPESMIEDASRSSFVDTVRGIKKAIDAGAVD